MSRHLPLLLLLTVAALGCSSEPPPATIPAVVQTRPAPKDYAIKLQVPAKVGDERSIQLVSRQTSGVATQKGGKLVLNKEGKTEVILFATIKTLAVNERGLETRLEIAVDRFVLADEEKKLHTILPTGTVVVAEAAADATRFERKDGEALGELAGDFLPRYLPLHVRLAGAGEDQLFGTDQRQPVGGSWLIKKEAASKVLHGPAGAAPSEAVSGSGKLLRVLKVNGVECLELQFTIGVTQKTAADPPPGMKGIGSSLALTRTYVYPSDFSTGPLRRIERAVVQGNFQGVPGTAIDDVTMEFKSTDTTDKRVKYTGK